MNIRKMVSSDLSNIRVLWGQTGINLSKSDSIPELERMLRHNQKFCFVLENENKEIIGTVLGGFDGRRGWVHHLAVSPKYQRSGFGRQLINTLVTAFEEEKVIKIKLEVVDTNKNVVDFYKSMGWNDRPELITMSLDLPRKSKN